MSKKNIGLKRLFLELQREIKDGKADLPLKKTLTLNGRIPLHIAQRSLTRFQCTLFSLLSTCSEAVFFIEESRIPNVALVFTLGYKEYGRIILEEKPVLDETDFVVGYIYLPSHFRPQIRNMKITSQSTRNKEIEEYFLKITPSQIHEMIDFIYYNLYHMEPVMIYVEEDTLTTFSKYNNLIQALGGKSQSYLLDELKYKEIEDWSDNEKTFLYNMYWLLKSGSSTRAEEFNGVQLRTEDLHEYFDQKLLQYAHSLGNKIVHAQTIPEKAEILAKMHNELEKDFLFYRKINGINLNKEEDFIPKVSLRKETSAALPMAFIEQHLGRKNGIIIGDARELYRFFYDWILTVLVSRDSYHGDTLHPVEQMIHDIIKHAVVTTNSDFGMARSLRQFGKLIEVHERQAFDEACNWPLDDYYCCVVPSKAMEEVFTGKEAILYNILIASSIRMQYDSWHYLPGNFPSEKVSPERHYYFPPKMPDIAEWSDQHHRGHILAGVRYSIRSPESIYYKGKEYMALLELRLMRQKGKPYSLNELTTAIRYTKLLKLFNQALLDVIAETRSSFRIEAFDKQWYNKKYSLAKSRA